MKSGNFSKRLGAAAKGFQFCSFKFQFAFFGLNAVLYVSNSIIIAKFRLHYIICRIIQRILVFIIWAICHGTKWNAIDYASQLILWTKCF